MNNNRNKLLRYREIINVYNEYKERDVPDSKIWKKHIYPRFFISKRTLLNILNTPVERELKKFDN